MAHNHGDLFNLTTIQTHEYSLFHLHEGPHKLATVILLTCVSILLMTCTLIGNTLVCLAVILVKKLRKQPANYLLVSLAIADLCVGLFVMPLAFLYLILGRWTFGQFMCDVWTSADVTLCTASILNLCAISVDRYSAIVRPLTYGPKRTSRRMLAYVIVVWIMAVLVSFLPPIAFWEPSNNETCNVSQNRFYQIYATMASFYIPATIILLVNYKIYKAARRLSIADKKASVHKSDSTSNTVKPPTVIVQRDSIENAASIRNHVGSMSHLQRKLSSMSYGYTTKPEALSANSGRRLSWKIPHDDTDAKLRNLPLSNGSRTDHCNNLDAVHSDQSLVIPDLDPNKDNVGLIIDKVSDHLSVQDKDDDSDNSSISMSYHFEYSNVDIQAIHSSTNQNNRSDRVRYFIRSTQNQCTRLFSYFGFRPRPRSKTCQKRFKRSLPGEYSPQPSRGNVLENGEHKSSNRSVRRKRNRLKELAKKANQNHGTETRAMKTLGLIMGCFLLCWIPFFIVTLAKALCPKTICNVPPWLESLILWLGYANSTLNPILYAKYNKDFRIPFREMLCCRFRTLKSVLRMEDYLNTYGDSLPLTSNDCSPLRRESSLGQNTKKSTSLCSGQNTTRSVSTALLSGKEELTRDIPL